MSLAPTVAPYGTWSSPISADLIVAKTIAFAGTSASEEYLYHSETRPSEGGRAVIVRTRREGAGSKGEDVFGSDWNARTRVHEYGGGAFCVVSDTDEVIFSHFADGRLWRVAKDNKEPSAVTAESSVLRYAAFVPHPLFSSTWPYLLAVQEDHTKPAIPDVVNRLVLIHVPTGNVRTLAEGADFYSSPKWSPTAGADGSAEAPIIWLEWNHPDMPWESARLFSGTVALDEPSERVKDVKPIAGGKETSVCQPKWDAEGKTVYFIWDKSGFGLLYRWDVAAEGEPELAMETLEYDLADPDWQFGNSRYVLLSSTQALITPLINSIATPTLLDLETKKLTPVEPAPHVNLDSLFALSSTEVLFVGSTHDEPAALTVANLAKPKKASYTTIKPSAEVGENLKGMFASASGIELEVASGPLHILYFPPTNPKYTAPLASDGSVVPPPALFRAHGGPTSRSAPGHSWPAAYFTSRGYAVVDVNYAGSSGFGRAYRERLRGQWGVSDVADCASAVKGCVERGLVDATKVALSGGSAGGYTVLGALTTSDVFAAGISSYGISDLNLLADDTHKFESQYLFKLVGGTPAEIPDVYHDRSPVHSAEKITAKLLLLQGLEDKVVPPGQTRTIVEKIKGAGGEVEAVYYEGEGHGFRKADNIKDSLERTRKALERAFGIPVSEEEEAKEKAGEDRKEKDAPKEEDDKEDAQ